MGSDGPKESCVRWGPEVLRDGVMATNFWLLFDSRGWVFGFKLSDKDIADFAVPRDVAMATNFGTKIAITGFV